MSLMTFFGIIGAIFSVIAIIFAWKMVANRKEQPDNYIEFHNINGRRVAYLHMSKVVASDDDGAIIRAFNEAIHRLYNDNTVDPSDFMLAWTAYNDFRDSVEKVHHD